MNTHYVIKATSENASIEDRGEDRKGLLMKTRRKIHMVGGDWDIKLECWKDGKISFVQNYQR